MWYNWYITNEQQHFGTKGSDLNCKKQDRDANQFWYDGDIAQAYIICQTPYHADIYRNS